MIVNKFELYFKDVMLGRKRGIAAFFIKAVLLPLSWIYGVITKWRNEMYKKGVMRRYTPPVPLVISVGNIVAGGTGKTPVTLLLANAFYERFTIAVLTRGYRSKAEKLDQPVVLCEGQGPQFPASYCGDESYLFAQRFPKAIVIVGGNRRKASFLAARAGAQAIILDDGMQHLRLVRDFDVVVMDVKDPFGQGYFLPRGFLREDIGALGRADLLILNHITNHERFLDVKEQVSSYTTAPIVGSLCQVNGICNLKGEEVRLSEKEKVVGMFCAIAHPEYFRNTLEEEGFQVVDEYILADHEAFDEKKLEQFAQLCLKKGANYLVCTEKDCVKLDTLLQPVLPIIWIRLELEIVAGKEEWNYFLQKAEAKIK